MAITIYELKPRFQQLLRPLARALAGAGITANQVTLAAMLISIAVGAFVAWRAHWVWPFLLLPAWLFLRMAMNAIDGMLAALDPHSVYETGIEYDNLRIMTDGAYGGLGLTVGMDDGAVKVIARPVTGWSSRPKVWADRVTVSPGTAPTLSGEIATRATGMKAVTSVESMVPLKVPA